MSTMNLTHMCLKDLKLQARNPVKEILLKLNLPDHKSVLTDSKVNPTKHGRMIKPYSSTNFIANCFTTDSYKDGQGVLKLKNFKKDGYSSFQDKEKYEHVAPKVTSSQEGKRSDDDKRLDLADDLKEAQYHIQVKLKRTSSSLKSKVYNTYHNMMTKIQDYEHD
ncbi:hypothetical protein Tco_0087252 [Tanacetum coccineum]